ncbi:MAG: hydrolase TatD, partial [Polaribacter sp.]|nr:hydrolase TatD [Polaribacter sp.]
ETDAPYLAPTPFRGKRNESAYITNVIDKLVEIYKVPFEEIVATTTQNSKVVFGI